MGFTWLFNKKFAARLPYRAHRARPMVIDEEAPGLMQVVWKAPEGATAPAGSICCGIKHALRLCEPQPSVPLNEIAILVATRCLRCQA